MSDSYAYQAECEIWDAIAAQPTPKRYALVTAARSRSEAEAYLPENYRVIHEAVFGPEDGRTLRPTFVIEGVDRAGWTLDAYVIPRYASGLIGCQEIDLSHPIMREIPS